jgi:hypothetical protein
VQEGVARVPQNNLYYGRASLGENIMVYVIKWKKVMVDENGKRTTTKGTFKTPETNLESAINQCNYINDCTERVAWVENTKGEVVHR